MRPSHQHAPGMPNRLPDRPLVYDKHGKLLSGGRPATFQQCLKSMRKHHEESLRGKRDG